MTSATANRINSAACQVWFFQQGLQSLLKREYIHILQQVSVEQIQTASDFVEAENHDAVTVNGSKTMSCVLDASAARKLKAYADSLQA